jgi:hypothetical protein
MLCPRRRFACWLAVILASAAPWPALAGENFPFGSELILDVPPMPGSTRIPMLEIEDVGADSIAIVPGQPANLVQPPPCDSQQQADDVALLTALAAATTWRRSGDRLDLLGGVTLHYRLMTN